MYGYYRDRIHALRRNGRARCIILLLPLSSFRHERNTRVLVESMNANPPSTNDRHVELCEPIFNLNEWETVHFNNESDNKK